MHSLEKHYAAAICHEENIFLQKGFETFKRAAACVKEPRFCWSRYQGNRDVCYFASITQLNTRTTLWGMGASVSQAHDTLC